jgi:hypothetical protein
MGERVNHVKTMYEIRVYKLQGKTRIRTAKIKKPTGFFGWCRLWFTIKQYSVSN